MSMSNVKVNRSNNMQIRISKQSDHVLSCFRHFVWPSNLSFFFKSWKNRLKRILVLLPRHFVFLCVQNMCLFKC